MPDLDVIVKSLRRCSDMTICPNDCYYKRYAPDCVAKLHRDAINLLKDQNELLKQQDELLKEQEARVMTLDEVKAFDWDYCYLEEERSPGNEYRAVCGDYALTCITWPCVTSMRTQHGDENYGRKWRCWSAKPTNEQMKAAKWE